ncbi:MAG: ABC transporter permease, partial [Oscillospiraceae bacterium]|nr:ABC transporter permease [Oscillospiraceae bacterium]
MFWRMIRGAFTLQRGKMLMIALTIALGASLATAMLNVMLDVGDKVTRELKTYGANITVVPKASSVLNDLYEVEGGETAQGAYLREDELGNIKTIFWAFNIVDFAPFIDTDVTLPDGTQANMVGTWYNHYMALPTGETLTTGVQNLRTWWDLTEGRWLDEDNAEDAAGVMVGASLAQAAGLHTGDTLTVSGRYGEAELTVVGVYDAGDDADNKLFAPMEVVQKLSHTEGLLTSIEVSAITTPDNELAVKAAKDPKSLSASQYETWYCTAYVSSICFQIQEVITDAVASPVRQVADSEGAILEKTELLMVLITVLALVGSALGISN